MIDLATDLSSRRHHHGRAAAAEGDGVLSGEHGSTDPSEPRPLRLGVGRCLHVAAVPSGVGRRVDQR